MALAWIGAGLTGLALLLAAPAFAADKKLPLDARLSANAPADFAPSAGLRVRPSETDELQGMIAERFAAEIDRRGWPRTSEAPALLVFRYGVQATADPGKAPMQLQGGVGSSGGDDEAAMVMRLNLLGQDGKPLQTKIRTLTITVSDRRNRVLWQGTATASVGEDGDLALAEALVPKVLDNLGRDAFDEPLR
ncbi:MAG: DUF4136 domain-containing protein [Alphaproteobacteria bacterium]